MSLDPISIGLAVAGLAVSAATTYMEGRARQQTADYNAAVSRNNADVAEWQAQQELERGEDEVQRHFRQVAAMESRQRTLLAAGGADVGFGTAGDLLEDTVILGDEDAAIIKTNARYRAYERDVQAGNFLAEASLLEAQSDNINPAFGAGATLLGGASTVADAVDRTDLFS
ncbi:MAG: hypothetical protein AAF844_00160 [Pseudomonadota bacterium]